MDEHCSVRLHYIQVHEYLHCMYIVYAIPSLNKDVIIVVIIIVVVVMLGKQTVKDH